MIDMPDYTRSDSRLFADERGLFSTDQLNHAKIPPDCKKTYMYLKKNTERKVMEKVDNNDEIAFDRIEAM